MENQDERLVKLEKRVEELENLIDLLMTLKEKKVDISNFTCEKINLNSKRPKLFSNDML